MGAPVSETAAVLGMTETLARIDACLLLLPSIVKDEDAAI
jgi:hypothetical protein